MELSKATSVNSRAEELFVQLFCEAFGPEKTENLQVQYPCVDIYGRHRYIDFALESPESKIAIEIDGETYHNPSKVSENKYVAVLHLTKKLSKLKKPDEVSHKSTVFVQHLIYFKLPITYAKRYSTCT